MEYKGAGVLIGVGVNSTSGVGVERLLAIHEDKIIEKKSVKPTRLCTRPPSAFFQESFKSITHLDFKYFHLAGKFFVIASALPWHSLPGQVCEATSY